MSLIDITGAEPPHPLGVIQVKHDLLVVILLKLLLRVGWLQGRLSETALQTVACNEMPLNLLLGTEADCLGWPSPVLPMPRIPLWLLCSARQHTALHINSSSFLPRAQLGHQQL